MSDDTHLPNWLERPVLIYGPRKAGTTLLQNLLDGGDSLFVYPSEMKIKFFIEEVWRSQPEAVKTYYKISQVLLRDPPNFDKSEYSLYAEALQDMDISSLRQLIQRDIYGVYTSVLDRPPNPSYWCVKEVGGPTRRIASFWRQLFFNGKIVMIVRDPLMVTRSVLCDRRRKGIKLGIRKIITQTRAPLAVLHQQAQLVADESIHFVSYEDLTENSEHTIQGVCDYLGIDYEPVYAYPTVLGETVITSTSSVKTKEVFISSKKWYNDLTFKELATVWVFSKIFRLHFWLKSKGSDRDYLPYSDFLELIRRGETVRAGGS